MNEGESEEAICGRIICRRDTKYCASIRSGKVVFALINPYDRYQLWMKDERPGHGMNGTPPITDSEGQPAFALVNKATSQALSPFPHFKPAKLFSLVRYDVSSCNESVLWTMSKNVLNGFGNIRRVDKIDEVFTAPDFRVYDGHVIELFIPQGDPENDIFQWKIMKVLPSVCFSLFQPSQHTVKIWCEARVGYNLSIDNDGSISLVPSNPKDKYQHWIKETASSMPVKDAERGDAFALVNKATGKAIKHGYGSDHLVQVAPFNRNYMDASLLWTESGNRSGFVQIRMLSNAALVFDIFDANRVDCALLGLSKNTSQSTQLWKIEDFK